MKSLFIRIVLGLMVNTSVLAQIETIDLSGEWHLKLDPDQNGLREKWYTNSTYDQIIKLPGCLQEQGYGNIPNIETKWWNKESLQSWFDSSPWLKKYESADNFKTQAWLIPDRYYLGVAWYSKEFIIPENWDKKHITLFFERCHWESRLWIDGKYIGANLSLATPHIYDISAFTSGKHKIVLRIDNSEMIDLGEMSHAVSDQTAGTWNGIIGKLELRGESPVWIEDFQIYPNLENNSINIKGNIASLNPPKQGKWGIKVDVSGYNKGNNHRPKSIQVEGILNGSMNTSFDFKYNMGEDVKLWDEFDPNLYKIELRLQADVNGKTYLDTKEERFGMRKFERIGSQFSINGAKTFLRGNTDCAVTPKTGYTPMDVASWRKIWQVYKDFGLNMARFHSWCPPKAAFIAADEMGIYLAPEVGEWTKVVKQEQFDFLRDESIKILKTYGNSTSFIQMGLGNENSGDKKFFREIIDKWKATDIRHLYTIKANSSSNPENIDYEVIRSIGKDESLRLRYQVGWPPKPQNSGFNTLQPQTNIDWNECVLGSNIPLIQHETAQICAYPDILNELGKYDGYLKPTYLEIALDQLKERGMLEQLHQFVEASGKWQVELIREEFEAAYRTKNLAGFHWLGLADFTGQNTAPVGFTDAFYNAKPYIDASSVRRWNAPTVLLARMQKRIFTAGEMFNVSIQVTHYGKEDLLLDDLWAVLKKEDGTVLKSWEFDKKEFLQGSAQPIDEISYSFKNMTSPCKLVLELQSKKNNLLNSWNLWLYPNNKAAPLPNSIIVSNKWNSSIEKELKKGKTVLLLPNIGDLKGQLPICFTNYYWTSFGENEGQSSAAGVLINNNHPIFKDFPSNSCSFIRVLWCSIASSTNLN